MSVPGKWPTRSGRARVLVEDADGASQWAVRGILAQARYDVAVCDGPERLPKHRCPLVTDGRCSLAEGADVVLNSLPLTHEPNRDLLDALRARLPETPVIVEETRLRASRYQDAMGGCRLLPAPTNGRAILTAVDATLDEGKDARTQARSETAADGSRHIERLASVCDYVAVPLERVRELLGGDDVDDLLTSSLRAAIGPDHPPVSLQAAPLETLGRATALTRVTWRATVLPDLELQGVATITLHLVRSGREPLTELTVTVRADEETAARAAPVARRFLEEITGALAHRAE